MPADTQDQNTLRLPPPAAARYKDIELLGEGGMGTAYKAWDHELERHVAMKVIHPEAGDSPTRHKRFEREARSLAALDHPNVVTLYEFFDSGSVTFYTMEYVEGQALDEILEEKTLDARTATSIFARLADALAAVHAAKIVHRDIKPSNIMLTREGEPKLMDFGLAKPSRGGLGPVITKEGQLVGTFAYLPPEVLRGARFDYRSDIYQLGLTFYESLTGKPPFTGQALAAYLGGAAGMTADPPSEVCRDADEGLDRIVLRAIEPSPDDRYQAAANLAKDCTAWLESVQP